MMTAGQSKVLAHPKVHSFPATDLHRAVLDQILVHIECLEEQVRLVSHAFSQALKLRLVEVILEDRSVFWVCALLDDLACSFSGRQASHIGQTLFLSWSVRPGRVW